MNEITREVFLTNHKLVIELARLPGGVRVMDGERLVCTISIPSEPLPCCCACHDEEDV